MIKKRNHIKYPKKWKTPVTKISSIKKTKKAIKRATRKFTKKKRR